MFHPLAVAVEVAGNLLQCLGLGAGELALGHDQAQALDDLADVAVQDALGALVDELLGIAAALPVERVPGFPELLVTPATLQRLRELLPCEVRVTARRHPLCGHVLPARGFRRLAGELMLEVRLPDGSAGMVAAAGTDVLGWQRAVESSPGTVLSAEGVRRLRALLVAKSRGSGSRGTRRRAA